MKKFFMLLIGILLAYETVCLAASSSPALVRKYIILLEAKLVSANKDGDAARADKLKNMIADEKKRLADLEAAVGFPYQPSGTKRTY